MSSAIVLGGGILVAGLDDVDAVDGGSDSSDRVSPGDECLCRGAVGSWDRGAPEKC